MFTIKGYAKSVIGGREGNQDSFLMWPERNLYAVADGVGGGLRGDVASQMSVAGLKAMPENSVELRPVFQAIQNSVLEESIRSLGDALMGSTLTAALIAGDKLHVCHVGDSRCYVWRAGNMSCMTTDHEIFDDNIGGPVLASYMGLPPEVHALTIQEESDTLQAGDRILLCSDGLYKQITEDRMMDLIHSLRIEPEKLVDVLVAEASQVKHSDNVTLIWITVD